MSYSLISGTHVSASNHNGRSRPVTESKSPERTPWELLAWALLEQAVDDATILARYGLIKRDGSLLPWPRRAELREGYWRQVPMVIATMNDPFEHVRLRDFWTDPKQAQHWCDLVGFRVPAKDVWNGILKHHAQ